MKISASIYSSTKKSLEDSIRELDELNIDMIHVDFNDKKSDGKTVFADIKKIKTLTSKDIAVFLSILVSFKGSNIGSGIIECSLSSIIFALLIKIVKFVVGFCSCINISGPGAEKIQ